MLKRDPNIYYESISTFSQSHLEIVVIPKKYNYTYDKHDLNSFLKTKRVILFIGLLVSFRHGFFNTNLDRYQMITKHLKMTLKQFQCQI